MVLWDGWLPFYVQHEQQSIRKPSYVARAFIPSRLNLEITVSLPEAGGWNWMIIKVSSNTNHPMMIYRPLACWSF